MTTDHRTGNVDDLAAAAADREPREWRIVLSESDIVHLLSGHVVEADHRLRIAMAEIGFDRLRQLVDAADEITRTVAAEDHHGDTESTEAQYVIACVDRSHCHDVMVWWRPYRRGYTWWLDEAGRYNETEARDICQPDHAGDVKHLALPVADAEAIGSLQVPHRPGLATVVANWRQPWEVADDDHGDTESTEGGHC